jgi:ketosteroid isomerase-like protein
MDDSPEVTMLFDVFAAMSHGDLTALGGLLAPDARWRAVEDGPWNCEGRDAILDRIGRNWSTGLAGKIEETLQESERILVAFRPAQPREDGRPLDDGIAYVVVSFRDGKLVELKGCADRAAGLAYLKSGG